MVTKVIEKAEEMYNMKIIGKSSIKKKGYNTSNRRLINQAFYCAVLVLMFSPFTLMAQIKNAEIKGIEGPSSVNSFDVESFIRFKSDPLPVDYQVLEMEWDATLGSFVNTYGQTIQYSVTEDTVDYKEYRFESGSWVSNDFNYTMIYNESGLQTLRFEEEDWFANCEYTYNDAMYERIECSDADGVGYTVQIQVRESDIWIDFQEDDITQYYVSIVYNSEANTTATYFYDSQENPIRATVLPGNKVKKVINFEVLELDGYTDIPESYFEYEFRNGSYVKISEGYYVRGTDYDYEFLVFNESGSNGLVLYEVNYVDVDENNFATSITTKQVGSTFPSSKKDYYFSYTPQNIDVSEGPDVDVLGPTQPVSLQISKLEHAIERELKEVLYQEYNSTTSTYENASKITLTYSDYTTSDDQVYRVTTSKWYEFLFGDWADGQYQETFYYDEDYVSIFRLEEENYLLECVINYTEDKLYDTILCQDNDGDSEEYVYNYRTNDILITEKFNGEVESYSRIITDDLAEEITFISYDQYNKPTYAQILKGLNYRELMNVQFFDQPLYTSIDYSSVEYTHNGQNWYKYSESYWVESTGESDYEYHEFYESAGLLVRSHMQYLNLDENNYPVEIKGYDMESGNYIDRYELTFGEITVNNEDDEPYGESISSFELFQNYPNPFNPTTQIQYSLERTTSVRIDVFNELGKKVATLVDHPQQMAGVYRTNFDASSLSSGIYFYRLTTPEYSETKKMLLVK